ncbi:MAG: response regulator [Pseudomonadota bacterium]
MSANILLIDDYEPTALTMKVICEEKGFSFHHAQSAQDSIKIASDTVFDLILVDINLPDKSGTDLAPQMRDLCPTAKIIGFTADKEAVEENDAGAFDSLEQKNLEVTFIEDRLNSWLYNA